MLAATAPPTISVLLREQRYRRHFLPVDRRRSATGFLLISLSFYATARNDVLLFPGSALLTVALGVKLGHFIALGTGVVWLCRATWPRQHDRALILLCLATGLAIGAAILTRLATREVQGPMYASCAVMTLLYFSQRGLKMCRKNPLGGSQPEQQAIDLRVCPRQTLPSFVSLSQIVPNGSSASRA